MSPLATIQDSIPAFVVKASHTRLTGALTTASVTTGSSDVAACISEEANRSAITVLIRTPSGGSTNHQPHLHRVGGWLDALVPQVHVAVAARVRRVDHRVE